MVQKATASPAEEAFMRTIIFVVAALPLATVLARADEVIE